MMRTRQYRVWNEVVERGSVTKSQKGKKACVEIKVGECFQWKAHGHCAKEDCCYSHDLPASGNKGKGQRRKRRSCSPASHSKEKNRLTARNKNPHKDQAITKKTRKTIVKFHTGSISVKNRHVDSGILSCV